MPVEPPVLGWFDSRDFARARRTPGFSFWSRHRDFVAERDALFLGYDAAGVSALRQRVRFPALERWTRLTGAPLDIDGLDAFAAHLRFRVAHPFAPVVGRFGEPGDPERLHIDVAGAQCVLIRSETYCRWRREFASAAVLEAPDLDAYATLAVECCLSEPPRSRRGEVSSS